MGLYSLAMNLLIMIESNELRFLIMFNFHFTASFILYENSIIVDQHRCLCMGHVH